MNIQKITNAPLLRLQEEFEKIYLDVCKKGYSILGRTPAIASGDFNHWHFGYGHPPSYSAQARYRFLKTLAIARSLQAKTILEVAAGNGFNSACLWEPGRRVVINDLNIPETEVYAWSTGKNLELVEANLFDLRPELLGTFELVIACEVIEHVAHGDQLVNHLKQFLAPHGTLLLTTPNGRYIRSKLPTYSQITNFEDLESKQFKPDADGHLYLYTPEEMVKLLQAVGFKTIVVELYITPWLSGNAGLRLLPSTPFLNTFYYKLDRLTRKLGQLVCRKLCTQMIIIASLD